MELRFDTENTVNCPMKGASTRAECYDCRYFKMRFVDFWGGKTMVFNCIYDKHFPELEREILEKANV